jgi:hypothetical protein
MSKRKPKGWSVNDADHVPNGSRVLLDQRAEQIHPSIGKVHAAFGMWPVETTRFGVVESRDYGVLERYMVRLDGTRLSIGVEREQFLYPVPDGVIDLDPARRRRSA